MIRPFSHVATVLLSCVVLCPVAGAQEAPEVGPERITPTPRLDEPALSPCHADCRAARRSCRAACVDEAVTEAGDAGHRAELRACVAPCELEARACFEACGEQAASEP